MEQNGENDLSSLLYLMRNDAGYYKIGISKNVKNRRRQIENASGLGVSIIAVWQPKDGAVQSEKMLHRNFEAIRKYGEWFQFDQVPTNEISELINTEPLVGDLPDIESCGKSNSVGLLIKEYRLAKEVKQADLATLIGRPQSFISDVESGRRKLDIEQLSSLCLFLGLDLFNFISELQLEH